MTTMFLDAPFSRLYSLDPNTRCCVATSKWLGSRGEDLAAV
jgi:hypothetical protein